MKKSRTEPPDDNRAEAAELLKRLQRKGVRAVYLEGALDGAGAAASSGGAAVESGGKKVPGAKKGARKAGSTSAKAAPPRAGAGGSTGSEALDAVRDEVAACTQCALSESRTQTVFGVGSPRTKVMFIGEAPGRDEDRQGEPFVGRAGQLLTKILAAIDLRREDVYITNILKCRPPNNRDPQESEVRCCEGYLKRQIELIKPRYICALGRVSAQWLLQTNAPLGAIRSGEYYYEGVRVLATYHPAALLRNPNFKKPCWEDMKKLKALLDEG